MWIIGIVILIEIQLWLLWRKGNLQHKLVQEWLREVWREMAKL